MNGGTPPFTRVPTVLKKIVSTGTKGEAAENMSEIIINKNLKKDYNNSQPVNNTATFWKLDGPININNSKYKLGDIIWKPNEPVVSVNHPRITNADYSENYFINMEALSGIGVITWVQHEKKVIMFNDFSNSQKLSFMKSYKIKSELLEGISANEELNNDQITESTKIIRNIVNNTILKDYTNLNYLPAFREMSDFFVDNDME
jgi:hypothetical protein